MSGVRYRFSDNDRRVVLHHAWLAAKSAHGLADLAQLEDPDAANVSALLQEAAAVLNTYYLAQLKLTRKE